MADVSPTVGVVGATARAAAHSLLRAGLGAWAVDLFADRDLARHVPSARCPLADYPAALPALADQFPPGPVLYTGGLENHPAVVADLAARRPLWGNDAATLNLVRDPTFPGGVWPRADDVVRCPRVLSETERDHDDPHPAAGVGPVSNRPAGPAGWKPAPHEAPVDTWLVKPRRGAGGDGVRPFDRAALPPPSHFLQEFVPGEPMSALFLAARGDATLIAVTEQLVGDPWLHARRFQYAGNVGPVTLPEATELALWTFGRTVARHGGLVGLFGVDFQYAAGVAYPVEINPRYTASVEVIEHATAAALMAAHRTACEGGGVRRKPPTPHRVVGKAVYYAPFPITFPAAGPWDDDAFDPWRLPPFADVPDPGSRIEPGWPVFTLFEAGSSPAAVRARLQSRAAELDARFSEGPTG